MATRNPFSVSQAEHDSLKASLDALAAEYVAPLDILGEGLDRLSETFRAVGRSELETREALRDLAELIESLGLSRALRIRQGHEFWGQMRDAATRIRATPPIGSNPAAKRHPSKFGREYAEAGYALNHLLDAATWADAATTEAHLCRPDVRRTRVVGTPRLR